MIYAIRDEEGKWVVLKGWIGCYVGQGTVIEQEVMEKDIQERVREHTEVIKYD